VAVRADLGWLEKVVMYYVPFHLDVCSLAVNARHGRMLDMDVMTEYGLGGRELK